ncbi:ADP-ribosyl-[dinitrogen reductase] glycohydrolase [Methanoculleus chikugoensis]|jgi:ADP-ribosyl-[dinitrogen reductase] hydrolase|uniref:ADP-ribosyl-[dinitrogen reductase] glycohydrolase n=1 Tax=Methanoculleus chikugoensis TaxID=118126 RepID=A0A1M4MI59_9EURY|nr:ADP-ribosylglycohydrolase family protein [Methanoculleus chikugoensis]SCL74510.1 ADP-ribosyl-[dinitrogen reductase] glycohydrolase [Methanoculleus chikugoensis]
MHKMRAVGALVGLAIGDALGAPLEGLPPAPLAVTEMQGGGIHNVSAGQYTDDTLQASALAQTLLACGGFDPADFARRLVRVYHAHPEFFGPTSRAVLDLVDEGVAPTVAARMAHEERGGSRSNGSVMRGIPLGIFYPPGEVREVSLAASRVTHFDPVAGEASAFVNRMVSGICRGEEVGGAFGAALAACEDRELRGLLEDYRAYPPEPSLDAVLCTHCAVRVFMDAVSFREAVVTAVNLGGDADTVGAIVGGLAGARYGCEAIPSSWLAALRDREEIVDLARRLAGVSRA